MNDLFIIFRLNKSLKRIREHNLEAVARNKIDGKLSNTNCFHDLICNVLCGATSISFQTWLVSLLTPRFCVSF